jgi:hypothetical protein
MAQAFQEFQAEQPKGDMWRRSLKGNAESSLSGSRSFY